MRGELIKLHCRTHKMKKAERVLTSHGGREVFVSGFQLGFPEEETEISKEAYKRGCQHF